MRINLICLTILFSHLLFGQEWLSEYNKSLDYYNNFQLEEAQKAAEAALQFFKNENPEPHKNTGSILRQLALITYELGNLDDAVEYAISEVEVLKSINADADVNYANALNNLALIRNARSEYLESEPLLKNALLIIRQYNSDNSEEVAVIKGNYAIVLFQLKRDEEAEKLFVESLNILRQQEELPYDYTNILYNYSSLLAERANFSGALVGYSEIEELFALGAPNFEYGSILINVGNALEELGRFAEATGKYRLALQTFDQIGEQNSSEYAIAQNNLSINLQKTGRFNEAEDLVRKVLGKQEANKLTDPKSYVITASNFATLLIRKGELTDAKEQLVAVIQLYNSQALGKDQTYVTALKSSSEIDLSLSNLKEASQSISEAIEISENNFYNSILHSLYNQKSKVLVREGKYSEAKDNGDKALNIAENNFGSNAIQTAFIKNSVAGIYANLGEYEKAETLYSQSLPVFENIYGHKHPEYATSAANYSSLLQLMGNYYSAELYLADAVEIKRSAFGNTNPDFLTTYENLGLLYLSTARYVEAIRILEEIKKTKESTGLSNDPSLAYTYNNLGSAKKQVAEYTEAESYFRKAVNIYENTTGKSHIQYAATVNNLALLYQKMGNTQAAKPLFEDALSIYNEKLGRLSPDYATALLNLATLHQMENNTDKAKELLEEVLDIDEQLLGTDHPLYSKTLHNLAAIYEKTGDYDKSKELYQKSLDIYSRIFGEYHPSYASTLYNLAVLEQELENFDVAKTYFEKVVDIRKILLGEDHPDYAYSIYGLASISQKTGDFENARINYQIVIKKYLANIRDYFPALSESEKSAFYGKIRPVFEAFMDFAIEFVEGNYGTESDRAEMLAQIYDLQLSTKALLLNATNKVRNRILNSGDQELIKLFQDWIALKENIVKSFALSKEEIDENNIDIAAMEASSNDIEKQLSLKSSEFAQEFEKEQITWQKVRDALKKDEAAIEIIRIKKNIKNDSILYASLIIEYQQQEVPQLVLISNGDVLEDVGFKTYKNSIIYKIADPKSYNLFWKPIDAKISKNINNIYLSADGVYNKVNISTLLDKKEYVVEKYNIRLLSNTKELAEPTPSPNPVNFAQMFGFPKYNITKVETSTAGAVVDEGGMRYSFGSNVSELPGTLEEINNISAIMSQKSWDFETHVELNANEENIKKLNNPKIFHIATHGFFLEDKKVNDDENEGLASRSMKFNPLMRSGLLFAGAENTIRDEKIAGDEDGILTAYEAMNLNLDNTDLVVMSACETGLGEVKNGEGVYGLQRSFIVAGAKNLIMSLWKVNDETTQLLMSSFYNEWFSGKSKTEAFNIATQAVKKDYSHPYYWGAFVMLGK